MGLFDRFRKMPPPGPERDRLSLKHLRAAKADLARPRHILHFLYFGDESAARAAAETISAGGYGTTVHPPRTA